MARIRSVHPGLFTDEAFMELTVECAVAIPLLIGLWCEADDMGGFEWKPVVLKARYLPATSENAAALLDRLSALNFVRRFEIEGRAVGVVRNFVKYQRPRTPQNKLPSTSESRKYAGSDLETALPRSFPQNAEIEDAQPGPFPQNAEIASQREEGGGREGEGGESSSAFRAGASVRPPDVDLASARPLASKDLLEAQSRAVMGASPVVVDVDFSPISGLLHEPGVTRADIIAGLTEARDAAGFRPVSWRQCAGWVRKAAKNRLAAASPPSGARGPPAPTRRAHPERPRSALSVCLEIARGDDDGCEKPGFAGADDGPVLDGRAVAM